jgi:hypothetical protein
MVINCWYCGEEPTGLVEVTGLGQVDQQYVPTGWPPADDNHEHADQAPTPGELLAAGARAFDRVIDSWS